MREILSKRVDSGVMARVRLAWLPAVEAEVACGVLLSAGLDAVVIRAAESVMGGMVAPGDLQAELWVDESQLEQARALLAAQPVEDAPPDLPRAPAPLRRGPPILVTGALVVAVLVLAAMWWSERQKTATPNPNLSYEYTKTCVVTFLHDQKQFVSCDANGDGNPERVEQYLVDGGLSQIWFDSDEDGLSERTDVFDGRGRVRTRYVALARTGVSQRVDTFDVDGRLISRAFDEDDDAITERLELLLDDGGVQTVRNLDDYSSVEVTATTEREFTRRGDRAELVIRRDGGVVRRQVLTDDGWNDVAP